MKDEHAIEELAAEFLERRENGEKPEIEDFLADHPEQGDELRSLLKLMQDMDEINPSSRSRTPVPEASPERVNLPDLDYRLVRKLGSGGMGVVFEAVQISLNRKVAVKLLNSSLLTNADLRAQFENEARLIAMLHHPNIVKIYSAGCSEERCYYAMELIDGKGLDRCRIEDIRELARIALQAAQALAYAHRCGVLHRDIKPANMLLDDEGNVHLSDFGIAFTLTGDEPVMEKSGIRSGTLRYMAPERLEKGANTYATDQYSFGVSLYELITGQPMFHAGSGIELKKRITAGNIPTLSCRYPELAAIVNKCIRFRPEDRYKNMEEAASDLRRFLNHEPVRAFSRAPWYRFALWCRRKPAVAALTFASALCAAALVISLIIGYIQTRSALQLAEQNAAAADSVISQVFTRISEQSPSHKNSELLNTLLPYYQSLARQRDIPRAKLCEACGVIGECALRAGNYETAEKAFRKMAEYRSDAYSMNRLAEILKKRGRKEEADKISRDVIAKFEKSPSREERFETVRALLALSVRQEDAMHTRAFKILESLLKEDPANPEYRFQYALLLGGNPRLSQSLKIPGVEPNAAKLLAQLANTYPDKPEYSLALIKLMYRRFRFVRSFQNSREAADDAVLVSERMLGRWPNDPQIVSAAVRLHSRYIDILRKRGVEVRARKENDRLLNILEILFYNPEISDAVKEELIQLQLRRLQMFRRRNNSGSHSEIDSLVRKIDRELEHYRGSRRQEFRDLLYETTRPDVEKQKPGA